MFEHVKKLLRYVAAGVGIHCLRSLAETASSIRSCMHTDSDLMWTKLSSHSSTLPVLSQEVRYTLLSI